MDVDVETTDNSTFLSDFTAKKCPLYIPYLLIRDI